MCFCFFFGLQESSSLGTSLSSFCWAGLHLAETCPHCRLTALGHGLSAFTTLCHLLTSKRSLCGGQRAVAGDVRPWRRKEEVQNPQRLTSHADLASLGQPSTCQGSLHRAEGPRSCPLPPTLFSPGLGLPGKEGLGSSPAGAYWRDNLRGIPSGCHRRMFTVQLLQ